MSGLSLGLPSSSREYSLRIMELSTLKLEKRLTMPLLKLLRKYKMPPKPVIKPTMLTRWLTKMPTV